MNLNKMKKSQVRIGETIAIMFIFIIIVVLGFGFYARIQRFSVASEIEETTDLRAIEITQLASHLAALQCSSKNIVVSNCFDILKIEAFRGVIENNKIYYYDEFLFSQITVEQIYPNKRTWTIYNNSREDSSASFTPVPILLYNSTSKIYNLGVLEVTYYPFNG